MSDRPPLVIRFGRLGDLVLTWPALEDLSRRRGPVDLVTSRQYAALMEALPWVGRVWALEPGSGRRGMDEVGRLAAAIRERGHGEVIDLHGSLRSWLLCARLGGADRRVDKGSLQRRIRVGARIGGRQVGIRAGQVRPFTRRFLDAVGADDECPEVPAAPPALLAGPRQGILALAPGARRATKRWPARRFGELAGMWFAATGEGAVVLYGPGEEALVADVCEASRGAARPCGELDLPGLLRDLGRCAVAVGGDTGLIHLAAAAGARPLGLFGPTGVSMGYWPWSDRGAAIAPELSCHPCTLYGSDGCPLEHHACLADLDTETVFDAALALAAEAE